MNADALKKLTTDSLNQLASMLDEGRSERLTSLLTTMARFHRYSLHNVCLIVAQRPTATRVAGFHTWRSVGRFVRKGEKGIAIMAPIVRRRREDADDDEARTIVGFRAAYVFDVEQTDGEPLPQPAEAGGDPRQNTLRVELQKDGQEKEYDPRRLRGVAVYEAAERNFAKGDRIQLTAPDRTSGLANRELGKIERIDASGQINIKTDSGRTAAFSGEQKHLDHGYAVTSHSAQGATADRVIIHAESDQSAALVNQRFAYVAGSRMRDDIQVYTNDAQRLESALDRQFDKTTAVPHQATTHSSTGRGLDSSQQPGAPGQSTDLTHDHQLQQEHFLHEHAQGSQGLEQGR